jgi:trimethylamine--corrinoid protein Co-methyltransferase
MDYLVPFTAERRPFTLEDLRTTATVLDALPNYHWGLTFGLAKDVPANIADRVVMKEALKYTQKPLVVSCKDINSLKDIYEMVTLLAGNEKRFRHSPNVAILVDPISPLLLSNEVSEKIIFCARKGIPQICFSAPQSGSTAPATLAGTIVEASAESLAGIVLAQTVRQGAPIIYGGFPTVMDMRTTIFSYGAPEMSLMSAGMASMAHYYRLPCFGTAGCSDSKLPDSQAAAEATYSCFSSSLSGANMIHDSGLLDHGSMVSPAFMVLVSEILEMIKHYMRGILVNDDTLALEIIHGVGPGGHFMEEKHTLDHYREVWYSNLFDRSLYDTWLERGGRRFRERLTEQTQETVEHEPEMLPEAFIKELDRMATYWK